MLLVDNPGIPKAYPRQLRHGYFDAFTAADVVFPLFLFVVGVAMPLSGRTADGRAVLVRSLKLFALGCLLVSIKYGNIKTSHVRWLSSGPRLAVSRRGS